MDKHIPLTIVIVDDCSDDHFFIKDALSDFKNIRFMDFYDGENFLHYLQSKSTEQHPPEGLPDIVILDINMPKMNGFEVFEFVEKNDLRKDICFYICTTSIGDKEKKKCCELDLPCYQKPFNIARFTELLEKMIRDCENK